MGFVAEMRMGGEGRCRGDLTKRKGVSVRGSFVEKDLVRGGQSFRLGRHLLIKSILFL